MGCESKDPTFFTCAASKEAPATRSHQSTKGRVVVEKSPLHREETDQKATISLDVSGFSIEQLKIEIDNHVLTVSGQRTNKLGDTFVMRRRLALKADVYDEEAVEAQLEHGVLELTVPKIPIRGARFIPITLIPASSSQSRPNEKESSVDSGSTSSKDDTADKNEPEQKLLNPSVAKDADVSVETVSNEEEEEDGEEEIVFSGASANESELVSQTGSESAQDSTWEEIKA